MNARVLLLGGTAEAGWLARELAGCPTVQVITSLAGRIRDPLLPLGQVRIGGFGGAPGLLQWLREHQVRAVVDATHPFAAVITAAASVATTELGLPFVVLRRPGWQVAPGDDWRWADTLDDAAAQLPELGRRAFLNTGRTVLAAFSGLDQLWCLVRAIDAPARLLRSFCDNLTSIRVPFCAATP